MGIFYRRPLCFFCFLFVVTSALLMSVTMASKLILLCALALCLIATVIMLIRSKNSKVALIALLLCICSVGIAVASSLLRMDIKEKQAKEYIGNHAVEISINSKEYSSAYSSAYSARLRCVDNDKVSVKVLLMCGFQTNLSVGDTVYANADIMDINSHAIGKHGTELTDSADTLLIAVVYEPDDGLVSRFDRDSSVIKQLLSRDGAAVLLDDLKHSLNNRMTAMLGDEVGAVARAFLLGDKSDISTEIIRDFRRTGVSHLFAVSGLHITVLLGAIEILLRKLFVPKSARCIVISLLALVLLCLTGFAMSALRSVLMLWIVYIMFAFSEENDPLTVLFIAVTLIILIFPYSVFELGMWMSFLATLGLVTVYPFIEAKIPRVSKKRVTLRISRAILLIAIMTVISNIFLLPIQWKIFGEISAVSIPTNILLSPLNALYLITTVLVLIFGKIPFIGAVISNTVKLITWLTLRTVSIFSSIEGATVSLKYPFCDALVIIFTAVMTVLLVVRLKRKWLILTPIAAFVLTFTVCTGIFYMTSNATLTYYGKGTDEILTVSDGTELVMIDVSNGTYSSYSSAFYDSRTMGATDVDSIVFSRITARHVSSMDYFMRNNLVKRIYIPLPMNENEYTQAVRLATLADECGVSSYLYQSGELLEMTKNTDALINIETKNGINAACVCVGSEKYTVGYTDARLSHAAIKPQIDSIIGNCNTVIIGNNAIPEEYYSYPIAENATLIYTSENIMKMSEITHDRERSFCNLVYNSKLSFPLE